MLNLRLEHLLSQLLCLSCVIAVYLSVYSWFRLFSSFVCVTVRLSYCCSVSVPLCESSMPCAWKYYEPVVCDSAVSEFTALYFIYTNISCSSDGFRGCSITSCQYLSVFHLFYAPVYAFWGCWLAPSHDCSAVAWLRGCVEYWGFIFPVTAISLVFVLY